MFDLDFGKLVVIGIIALIAIGPKELPAVLRTVGQYMAKVRRMAAEFQGQFQEAMREAEMADMKKHVDEIHEAARGLTSSFDPLSPTQTQTTAAAEHKPAAAEPAGNAPVEVAVSPPEPEAAVTAQEVVAAQPDLAGVAETPRPADAPEPRDRPA